MTNKPQRCFVFIEQPTGVDVFFAYKLSWCFSSSETVWEAPGPNPALTVALSHLKLLMKAF